MSRPTAQYLKWECVGWAQAEMGSGREGLREEEVRTWHFQGGEELRGPWPGRTEGISQSKQSRREQIWMCPALWVRALLDHVRYVSVPECCLAFVFWFGFRWFFWVIFLFLLKMEYSMTILAITILVNQDFTLLRFYWLIKINYNFGIFNNATVQFSPRQVENEVECMWN